MSSDASSSGQIVVAKDDLVREVTHRYPFGLSKRGLDISCSLASGAVAGAVAKTTIAPLDRTKIFFQVSNERFTYQKAYAFLKGSYDKYGLSSWWRGNSATLARIIPYAAIQFTAHEQIKRHLGSTHGQPLPPARRVLAGSSAGVCAAFCTYPLDLVRARLAVARRSKYFSLKHAFSTIISEEGFKAYFNGFVPTVCGIIPYAGVSFFTYETLKVWHHAKFGEDSDIGAAQRLLFGAVAGLCGQSCSYPFDIVRRRMQTDGLDGKGYKYRKLFWTIRHVLSTEGVIKGFYKGMSLNWIKGPTAVGISFMTYESVQNFFGHIIKGYKPQKR